MHREVEGNDLTCLTAVGGLDVEVGRAGPVRGEGDLLSVRRPDRGALPPILVGQALRCVALEIDDPKILEVGLRGHDRRGQEAAGRVQANARVVPRLARRSVGAPLPVDPLDPRRSAPRQIVQATFAREAEGRPARGGEVADVTDELVGRTGDRRGHRVEGLHEEPPLVDPGEPSRVDIDRSRAGADELARRTRLQRGDVDPCAAFLAQRHEELLAPRQERRVGVIGQHATLGLEPIEVLRGRRAGGE